MNKLKEMFKSKKFIYGSGSMALIAGFIVAMVILNLISGMLTTKFSLKFDLTENKIFALSDETKKIIKAIDKDVNIIYFVNDLNITSPVREILERFSNENKKIKLELIDPEKTPMYAQKYNSVSAKISYGSVVFDSGKSFKIVTESDLTAYNYFTQSQDLLVAENKFASALVTITRDKTSMVAFTGGHGEKDMTVADGVLKGENFKTEKFNILTDGFKPEYDMVIIAAPQTDFTAEEIEKLDQYAKTGKNIQVYYDLQMSEVPKLDAYLSEWGIKVNNDVVIEGDSKKVMGNVAYSVIPELKKHQITDALISNNLFVSIPFTKSISKLWDEKNGVKVESLMETSSKSYAKSDINSQEMTKEAADKSGPLPIVTISTNNFSNDKSSKILVTGTTMFLNEQLLQLNKDFFINSIVYMTDSSQPLNISAKSLSGPSMQMNQLAIELWFLFVVILIPLLVLLFGFTVWLRRRHL